MNSNSATIELAPIMTAVDDLAHDLNTREVWLIGSRANGTETEESDWDLLVFSFTEPVPILFVRTNIDVLRVGPSGNVLFDGETIPFTHLDDFQWLSVNNQEASYLGKDSINFVDCVPRDYAAPRFIRTKLKALLVWSREGGMLTL